MGFFLTVLSGFLSQVAASFLISEKSNTYYNQIIFSKATQVYIYNNTNPEIQSSNNDGNNNNDIVGTICSVIVISCIVVIIIVAIATVFTQIMNTLVIVLLIGSILIMLGGCIIPIQAKLTFKNHRTRDTLAISLFFITISLSTYGLLWLIQHPINPPNDYQAAINVIKNLSFEKGWESNFIDVFFDFKTSVYFLFCQAIGSFLLSASTLSAMIIWGVIESILFSSKGKPLRKFVYFFPPSCLLLSAVLLGLFRFIDI